MPQFDLYKKRNFGDYISDTITFLRTYGKHYFGNYFKVNGVFLLILSAVIFLLSNSFISNTLANLESAENGRPQGEYSGESFMMIGSAFVIMMLLIVLLSLVSVTYTVIYFGLLEQRRNNDFSSREIWQGLKSAVGRMFVFFFASLLTIIPLTILLVIVFYVKQMAIIMIPIFIVFGSAFLSWVGVSYYIFILEKKGFFASLQKGFAMVKDKFWPIIGATLIISLIVQILQSSVTMIPYVIGIVIFLTSMSEEPLEEHTAFISIGLSIMFVISVFAGYFFNNLMVVNQGLIYYTAQENEFNNAAQLEIDNIGTDIE